MKSEFFRNSFFHSYSKIEKGRIYLFCGLGGTTAQYLPAITKLRKNGFSVVVIRFRTKAMLGLTVENLPQSIDDVCMLVATYENQRTTDTPAIVIGNSMGSVFAWHAAKRVPSISKVIINTGYALISKHIFEDKIGQHWRKKLEKDGIDQKMFNELISESEPIANFDKLKGKEVLLFMNRDDNIISFEHAKTFKDALDEHDIVYKYVENSKTRHGTAIMKNLLGKQLLEFIKL